MTTILMGWKQIATFLGVSVKTAKRYHRGRPLPIRRESPGGAPRISSDDLLVWEKARYERKSA